MKKILATILCMGITFSCPAQDAQVQGFVHEQSKSSDYIWPTDQLLQAG